MSREYVKEHDKRLDLVRGLAMLMVILSHNSILAKPFHDFLYSIHNSLFFIVGGYLFHESYINKQNFSLTYKLKCILIPYLFWSIIASIVHVIAEFDFSLWNIVKWLKITIVDAGSIWFFASYASIQSFFYILLRLIRKNKLVGLFFIIIIYSLPIHFFAFSRTKWMMLIFGIGLFLAKYKGKYDTIKNILKYISVVWIPMAIYGGEKSLLFSQFSFSKNIIFWWIYYTIIAFWGFIFFYEIVCKIILKINILTRCITLVGINTIAIYPISIFFSQYFVLVLEKLGINNYIISCSFHLQLILILLYSFISLVCSWIIDNIFKKCSLYYFVTRGKFLYNPHSTT